MSKGYALHIGLNKLDPNHYPGVPDLRAAENDALFWKQHADSLGYETNILLSIEATVNAFYEQMLKIKNVTNPGDIVLLTYAGHGSQVPNDKADGFDNERNDQTWCLYDRELLDDELFDIFRSFEEGIRIVVVADSCHSGTMVRDMPDELDLSNLLNNGLERGASARGLGSRKLPLEVEQEVMSRYGDNVYAKVQDHFKTKSQAENIKASVKLMAACQDDQTTFDGDKNGVFTESFMKIFSKNGSNGLTAEQYIDTIRENYYYPRPNFFEYGGIIPTFDKGSPFDIQIPDAAKVTGKRKPVLKPSQVSRDPSFQETWDTLKVKKNAQLLIAFAEEPDSGIRGGKDMEILEQNGNDLLVELKGTPHEHGWSAAHALQQELAAKGYVATVEPVLSANPSQDQRVTREGDINNPDFIKEWPPLHPEGKIGWHLDEQHSQLAKAQELVRSKAGSHVKVGHFDTGYIAGHPALPEKLDYTNQRSFVNKEDPFKAIDKPESGQDGHGLGTLILLAGNKVTKAHTFDEYEGYVGGAPIADVVPMRISESVVIMNDKNFSEAIDYAIKQGCEVISMSMAGKPSNRMARAVNKAYEAGIVMVTAASNCWYKGTGNLLPKCVMYPAAFERVIAATGALHNHRPYDVDFLNPGSERAISTQYMQGSWGPASRMTKALAAYTPNTPWASTKHTFLRSGGGTSSATPQVAAAAALYIAYHRDEMENKGYYRDGRKWLKVEAVRHALYTAAAKDELFVDWQKYYGNGILKAYDALQVPVADESQLQEAPSAESSLFGVIETIGSFFKRRKLFRSNGPRPEADALAMELIHLLQTDPQFFELFSRLDLSDPAAVETEVSKDEFKDKVTASPYASAWLKEAILQ